MAIEKIAVSMDVPKEGKEIVDFLDKVLEKVMNKAELAEYATLITAVMPAIDGAGKIGEEMKSDGRDELAGYLVQKLLSRLLPADAE